MHKYDAWLLKSSSKLHKFLMEQGAYAVVFSTLLCFALWAVRVYWSKTWSYRFLLWNLFLAWLPYVCSLWAGMWHRAHPRWWWGLLLPGGLCIAFFPNAPYIVTDFLHLREHPPIPLWFDIGLLANFAWSGIALGAYALRIMQRIVQVWLGHILGWLFALIVIALSGTGIYLGRFLRWNSWDLVIQPKAIVYDLAMRLHHPLGYKHTYAFTLLFAALMFACYLTIVLGPTREYSADAPQNDRLDSNPSA